ncbi:hypothetical protein [Paraburkholderia youngii]|uniref:hypothetical protein n=1 Tax=Paraburkholderia youngii TaxID=2782701 RepID=UPI003D1BB18D
MTRAAWAVASLYPPPKPTKVSAARPRRPRAKAVSVGASISPAPTPEPTLAVRAKTLKAERTASADAIPEYATRFSPPAEALFRIDSQPSLVRFLRQTEGRREPLRIVRQKSRLAEWYEVEAYNARRNEWILRHTSPHEAGATAFAETLGVEEEGEVQDSDAESASIVF